ncbi:THUMP domain-containing class I SAM-dependent RNA methyltransferase [Caminicella sporogenes]|uniref:THUMP domain-containing class I SAM-dependent RNA methyltransferase n=1 Tax=Caminicella sporogenes TaxID=166485 RepID=UPI0025401BD6|nr:class I SAM-dependent RNA methyltransferase [Caminicella sporogenes]WIF95849.1 class I SAM-dependent RNA methyltransferase [Caminicella sporogenes]
MAKFELIATSAFGIEALVARELRNLGYDNIKVENGKVTFVGNEEAICKSNLWLRCADRVFLKVGEFRATTFEELFQQIKALPWENYLPVDANFPVNAKSVKSQLFSLSDIQAISKKAIVERMKEIYLKEWFEESGSKYPILISILKNNVTVMIDTSGTGLHKRGYREIGSEAPLKETLAAAMIMISRWKPDRPIIDPFCGSGTIPIEAALIGRNIAPGLSRTFISEKWDMISEKIWKKIRKEAYEAIEYDKDMEIYGYDINGKIAKIAINNSIKAGVDDCIHIQKRPVSQLSTKKKYGYIICNPPYGERLKEKKEVENLYKEMGKVFRNLDTWSYYILTSYEKFEKCFGKKADKNRKLYNGGIKCYYYQYFGPKPPKK